MDTAATGTLRYSGHEVLCN